MSKEVLVISGSPRIGGNSDYLCDEFIKGAKESGHNTQKVNLTSLSIKYCSGCGVCNNTHSCVMKDDMADLLDKMVKADVIVLATPVYFYSMNGQLKTMIDRTVPRYTEISNKDFYFILTAADASKASMEKTIEGLRGFTEDCLTNPHEKEVICGLGVWQVGEIKGNKAVIQAYNAGKNI